MGENTTEATFDIMKGFVGSLANMEFNSVLIYALLTLAAAVICFEGYRIYKVALMMIGFAVGYSRIHHFVSAFQFTDEQMLMIQTIAGIVCAVLAGMFVHLGIFIAAYHFAQANLSAIVVAMLADKVNIPAAMEPIFTRLAGVLVALIIAWLAVKSERLVVVILTAVVGGFAAVNFFFAMVPIFPVDILFFQNIPAMAVAVIKVALSAAGVGIQGVKK